MVTIDSTRPKSIDACEIIRNLGYKTANRMDIETDVTENIDIVGILSDDTVKTAFYAPARRRLIGRLYFRNKKYGASNKKWILDVYGRNNLSTMIQLANRISTTLAIDIHVKIVLEKEKAELFLSDWYD